MKHHFNWTSSGWIHDVTAQNCSDMNVFIQWKGIHEKMFVQTFPGKTDWGVCCVLVPYLEFENAKTSDGKYFDENVLWSNKLLGHARNGISKGIWMFLDLEAYEYADYVRAGSTGLRICIGHADDKQTIGQYGSLIRTGDIPTYIDNFDNFK